MSAISAQLLTGVAYGMLYFMIAAGLTIILGVMNVVNLAHGTLFMLGAYIAFTFINEELNFWIALFLAVFLTAIFGLFLEKWLIKHVYGKELEQVLLTFGLSFIIADAVEWIWGTEMHTLPVPDLLSGSLSIGDTAFPVYRLFVVFIGCLLALLLWYLETKTRIGAIIRAGVDDRAMVSALGINVGLVFTGVFAFGAALAGLSGVLGGPLIGMYTGMDSEILVTSLIVVVIGGLGSWKGSFIGAIAIGVIETLGKVWFPSLSMLTVFLIMMIVLIIRPQGLFGREVA
ncbi:MULTISPECIES: branched-chain amino acid ABC transporter permease [Geobacillus]|uniref:Branched-chain amino acid ABC transporter permease n=1 Tax=Geobacillus zalihae TaxID=213419 RepID=A0A7H1RWT9_9BACL|nr:MULTISPECIES: branched-chain amino acid ABC transporter permease [Geobacillus]ADU93884.1 inner-membrane translocator [Geobacillus sp. Y412MC52]AGE22020.1 inner-membrane translocator [Geobacillus sp. GHH01]AMQ20369.1 ABC transporter permease [Geobacillus sp. JS12]OQP22097.1 branched-chain amino acid ABC transporter permease [Geobacillus zalihae]QNU18728.1 branched-chain amino acid ABC transporter permease [Geobacillus zalihae]